MNTTTPSPTPETDAIVSNDTGDSGFLAELIKICRKLERERDEAREQLQAMREAVKNTNHFASIILAEAGKQWLATEPLPDVASIEAVAQQIKDELKPFLP